MKKLSIELVPSSTWGINLRSLLKKSQWDKIRKREYKRADYRCEICGKKGRIEGHEIWEYDDKKKIQKLKGIVCLCNTCHAVKHFGRSQLKGLEEKCIKQMMKVNKWTRQQVRKHIAEETGKWNERSNFEWTLDIEFLERLEK